MPRQAYAVLRDVAILFMLMPLLLPRLRYYVLPLTLRRFSPLATLRL